MFLHDENGVLQDKFKAKANQAASEASFAVLDLAYSSDSTRLALAQSDNILYVYKLGIEWKEKKSITNKFSMQVRCYCMFTPAACAISFGHALRLYAAAVRMHYTAQMQALPVLLLSQGRSNHRLCMCRVLYQAIDILQAAVHGVVWRLGSDQELVFGLADGSVRLGDTVKNRSDEIHRHPQGAPVVAMALLPSTQAGTLAPGIVVGHTDGSIYRHMFPAKPGAAGSTTLVCKHPCAPSALACNAQAIFAAGMDLVAAGYSLQGRTVSRQDLSSHPELLAFTCAVAAPDGSYVVAGASNAFLRFNFDAHNRCWQTSSTTAADRTYSITALALSPSSATLAVGSLAGAVEMYTASMRRARYCPADSQHAYELVWHARSEVQITGPHGSFKFAASGGTDVTQVDIYRDQHVVAFTPSTLLLGNLQTFKMMECSWARAGDEKFHFEGEGTVLVYSNGQLTAIDFEHSGPVATVRTAYASPYLMSCTLKQGGRPGLTKSKQALTYLIDLRTICVLDVETKASVEVRTSETIPQACAICTHPLCPCSRCIAVGPSCGH